jgi:release factor glutamine methyltransferase
VDKDPVITRLRAAGCVFAEDEARVIRAAARTPHELSQLVDQRVKGLPLEQVVGYAEFCGLRIYVETGVFVPRPRSEFLVDTAVALSTAPRPVIVDLCCGTGALGLATAARLTDRERGAPGLGAARPGAAELHAADLDPAAVRCARRNVEPAGGRVYEGDLFAPLPATLRGRVTILICNAPYVPTHEIPFLPAEARDYEHHVALDGGDDGLAVLRRAAAEARDWLAPGGRLLVETSERQGERMSDVMDDGGLIPEVHENEDFGSAVVTGTMSA